MRNSIKYIPAVDSLIKQIFDGVTYEVSLKSHWRVRRFMRIKLAAWPPLYKDEIIHKACDEV
jgi:hypothetical protein